MVIIGWAEYEAKTANTLIYKLKNKYYSVQSFERDEFMPEALKNIRVRANPVELSIGINGILNDDEYKHPNLMILTAKPDSISGFNLTQYTPAKYNIPITPLIARNEETDYIVGLKIVADDDMKMFSSLRGIFTRVKTALNWFSKQKITTVSLSIDASVLSKDNALIHYNDKRLTFTRYKYLPCKTFTYLSSRFFLHIQLIQIMKFIWQNNLDSMKRTIDIPIKTIKQKLIVINHANQPRQDRWRLDYLLSIS